MCCGRKLCFMFQMTLARFFWKMRLDSPVSWNQTRDIYMYFANLYVNKCNWNTQITKSMVLFVHLSNDSTCDLTVRSSKNCCGLIWHQRLKKKPFPVAFGHSHTTTEKYCPISPYRSTSTVLSFLLHVLLLMVLLSQDLNSMPSFTELWILPCARELCSTNVRISFCEGGSMCY